MTKDNKNGVRLKKNFLLEWVPQFEACYVMFAIQKWFKTKAKAHLLIFLCFESWLLFWFWNSLIQRFVGRLKFRRWCYETAENSTNLSSLLHLFFILYNFWGLLSWGLFTLLRRGWRRRRRWHEQEDAFLILIKRKTITRQNPMQWCLFNILTLLFEIRFNLSWGLLFILHIFLNLWFRI